jgi:phenylalanyl-tRNA synthetase beta subunit
MGVRTDKAGWSVQPPSWRFDIEIEADLIEEVVRIGGLDGIEESAPAMPIVPRALGSGEVEEPVVMRTLAARGYQEVITFAFVDPALQRQLFGEQPAVELANPIAADLSVMRSSLLPGLLAVARENLRRQQQRLRLFEIATRFVVARGDNGDSGRRQGRRRARTEDARRAGARGAPAGTMGQCGDPGGFLRHQGRRDRGCWHWAGDWRSFHSNRRPRGTCTRVAGRGFRGRAWV